MSGDLDQHGSLDRDQPGSSLGNATPNPTSVGAGAPGTSVAGSRSDHTHQVGAHASIHIKGGSDQVAVHLADLADAIISSPATGQVLTWNGTSWANEASGAGVALDTTAADIAATGAEGAASGAGAIGKAADSGHVHPTGAHVGAHNPGGTDAIATAAPGASAPGDAAAAGTAASVSHSDHKHSREAWGVVAQVTVTSAEGATAVAGATGAVADAGHQHPTGAHVAAHNPGGTDAIATAVAGASAPGDAAATGTAASVSHSDHKHSRETWGVVGSITATGPEGSAATAGATGTLADAGHQHPTGPHAAGHNPGGTDALQYTPIAGAVAGKTANYSMATTDGIILASGTITITLPNAAAAGEAGRQYAVTNTGTGTVTVNTAGGNINGAASETLAAGHGHVYVSDGANWWVFAGI